MVITYTYILEWQRERETYMLQCINLNESKFILILKKIFYFLF